jgi:hypothetical protein
MKMFRRAEHWIIAQALSLMDHAYLFSNQCWFGRGTPFP